MNVKSVDLVDFKWILFIDDIREFSRWNETIKLVSIMENYAQGW